MEGSSFRRDLRRAIFWPCATLGTVLLLLLGLALVLFHLSEELERRDRAIAAIAHHQASALDSETGLRGFLLTGERSFLEPWERAQRELAAEASRLRQLVADPAVAETLRRFVLWQQSAAETLRRQEAGDPAARAPEQQRAAKALFDDYRHSVAELLTRQEALRDGRVRLTEQLRWLTLVLLTLGGFLGIPLLAWRITRATRRVGSAYSAALRQAVQQRDELGVTLQSIGDAVLITDQSGHVAFLNPVAEKLTGWSQEEARGRPMREVCPLFLEQSGEPVPDPVERVLRGKEIVGVGHQTVLRPRHGGPEIPIGDSAAPIRRDDGTIRGVIVVFHDVTEKRAREQALSLSEHRYRLVSEAANDAIWDWDLATNHVTWNEGLQRNFGYKPAEVRPDGGWWVETIHPDDRERISREIHEVIDGTGERWNSEYRFRRQDGTWATVFDRGRVVRDAAGKGVRMVGSMLDLTERRKAELALRRQRERADLVSEAAQVGFWFCDLPFDELNWDALVKEHFWLPPDARVTIGLFYERIHPADREYTRRSIAHSIDERQPYDIEYRTVGPEGGVKMIRAIGRAFYDASGAPIRFDGVTLDITPHWMAEEKLRASEARSRAIIETALDAVLVMDEAGRIATWNPAAERLFGRSRSEAIGADLAGTILPERLRLLFHQELEQWRKAGPGSLLGQRQEVTALRRGHQEFAAELSLNRLPAQEPPLFVAFVRDISERKAAEAAATVRTRLATLRAEVTARLAAEPTAWQATCTLLAEHLGADLACLWLVEGEVPALSLSASAGPAQVPADSPHWQAGPALVARVVQTRAFTGIPDVSQEADLADLLWATPASAMAFAGFPLLAEGRLAGVLALFSVHPISGEVRKELEYLAETMAQSIARQAAQEAIRLARERAEAANRAKDNFLAALSHELRTPLTPVLLTAAALREDERLPEDVRQELGMMERNIALEARLIDDLLDLTRIAKGKLPLRSEDCDAHSLLSLAVEIVREEASSKPVFMHLQLSAQRSVLHGDPARLQQVFWNLLRNAIKFTPGNGEVTIRSRDLPDGCLEVSVADNGIGIAPEALEKVFLPFEQVGRENDHRFGGLGLGLTIARAIVDLHGGTIQAESAGPDQGAVFTVKLPGAREQQPGAAELPASASDSTAGELASQSPLHLLLIEDHEPTLTVLTRMLGRAGYSITAVSSVAGALSAAQAERFDLVISDLGLPDGSGLEAMTRLRGIQPGLTGVALSGYGMEEDLRRSRECGFFAHLVKPIDFDQLRRTLREAATHLPAR